MKKLNKIIVKAKKVKNTCNHNHNCKCDTPLSTFNIFPRLFVHIPIMKVQPSISFNL